MNRITQGKDAIGILGGMGSLATAAFFLSLVRAFPGEKEWDRPRIVVDNACQMPSRVRAILYGEKREELIGQLAGHMAGLVNLGCTDIVLCCNTSHAFLPQVLPLAQELCGGKPFRLRHILEILGASLKAKGVEEVSLIATEGTLDVGIYPAVLAHHGVKVHGVGPEVYPELRELIEAVKQDAIDHAMIDRFEALLLSQACRDVVLGCTEFPLLRDALGAKREAGLGVRLHDPLQATARVLVSDYLAEIG
ncbi:MAG: aspartate/glutamate racemase family protein [Clostridiales bacterium]|nr:aspartate/glutamate racemase family protein [Clostridiales bacterium]